VARLPSGATRRGRRQIQAGGDDRRGRALYLIRRSHMPWDRRRFRGAGMGVFVGSCYAPANPFDCWNSLTRNRFCHNQMDSGPEKKIQEGPGRLPCQGCIVRQKDTPSVASSWKESCCVNRLIRALRPNRIGVNAYIRSPTAAGSATCGRRGRGQPGWRQRNGESDGSRGGVNTPWDAMAVRRFFQGQFTTSRIAANYLGFSFSRGNPEQRLTAETAGRAGKARFRRQGVVARGGHGADLCRGITFEPTRTGSRPRVRARALIVESGGPLPASRTVARNCARSRRETYITKPPSTSGTLFAA